jgi:hypothetical protein
MPEANPLDELAPELLFAANRAERTTARAGPGKAWN